MIDFKDVIWLLVVTVFMLFSITYCFSIPDVYWSTSKDECVKVIYDGVETGCSDLPEKYNRIWVE